MSSATLKWAPKKRDYASERKQLNKTTTLATTHPLGIVINKQQPVSSTTSSTPLDPLSTMLIKTVQAEIDPLSRALAAAMSAKNETTTGEISSVSSDTFEPWSSKKSAILNRYITTEKISMTTATNNTDDSAAGPDNMKDKVTDLTTTTERIKMRLEQLDAFEGGQQTQSLTQQEYINRIADMSRDMSQAWKADQRVKTLKIVIQCCKLLTDMNAMEFYPSKFCLITDVLDTFGKLVYTRLLEKSTATSGKIPERIIPELIPEPTRETTRNWFFKIAIIRELLPRILVEVAILKCYNFLSTTHYRSTLVLLIKMCRGIGDPLLAAYARCYICRVGIDIDFKYRDHVEVAFADLFHSFRQVTTINVSNIYKAQKLTTSAYLSLYSPALDWIVQCLLHKADAIKMEQVIAQAQSSIKLASGGVLLNALLSTLPPTHVRSHARQFIEMINDCDETFFSKSTLYRSLGLCLLLAPSTSSSDLQLLNSVWKVVTKFKDHAVNASDIWLNFFDFKLSFHATICKLHREMPCSR